MPPKSMCGVVGVVSIAKVAIIGARGIRLFSSSSRGGANGFCLGGRSNGCGYPIEKDVPSCALVRTASGVPSSVAFGTCCLPCGGGSIASLPLRGGSSIGCFFASVLSKYSIKVRARRLMAHMCRTGTFECNRFLCQGRGVGYDFTLQQRMDVRGGVVGGTSRGGTGVVSP